MSGPDSDDIAIPPPREARVWYCADCGEPGGTPEDGYALMDRRYALGLHVCKKVARHVTLIADFAFDRDKWEPPEKQERVKWAGAKKAKTPKGPKERAADRKRAADSKKASKP